MSEAPSSETVRAFLEGVPLFRGARSRALEVAASVVRHRRFDADTLLFQEGDVGDAVYLLAEGLVKLSKVDLGGHEKTLALLRPRSSSARWPCSATRRSAAAITLAPTTCYLLFRDDFQRLSRPTPP
jgi:CRP/FNR family transcriptional regulator, cyclic AMP receptor protein